MSLKKMNIVSANSIGEIESGLKELYKYAY